MRARALLALCTGLLVVATGARAAKPPPLSARAAVLVESSTGHALYARHARQARAIASTTKMMTVLLALERLPLTRVLRVPPYGIRAAESSIGLRAGERMTVADLVRAALLPSANDAAHTLAVRAGGTEARFVRLMNRKARRLGLRHTHYATSVGLDTYGNYSSAGDLAKLAIVLRHVPFARRTMDLGRAVLRSGSHRRVVLNRNDLVRRVRWINGVKTGHTLSAGYVLVGSGRQRGMTLVSAVLGTPSEGARDADTLALLAWGFRSFGLAHPLRRGAVVAHARVRYDDHATVPLVAGRSVVSLVRRGTRIHRTLHAPRTLTGPLRRGARVGSVVLRGRGGRVLARVPLLTGARVKAVPLAARVFRGVHGVAIVVGIVALAGIAALTVSRRRRARRQRERRRRRREVETA